MVRKNRDPFSIKLEEWNERIRSGEKKHVQIELQNTDLRSIPREFAADCADIARRIGLFLIGLRILHPYVYSTGPHRVRPTQKELRLWAALLIKLGSIEEALRILEELDPTDSQVLLFMSFAHISQWDYAKAATCLRQYLKSEELDPYQRTIGQINLGAAYVYLRNGTKARQILSKALVTSNQENWLLLKSNALELLAGTAILNEQWDSAQRHLALAAETLSDAPLDTLLIRKMRATISLQSGRSKAEAMAEMEGIRYEAVELKHWETVRDCDYHLGLAGKDPLRLNLVYFGTPYTTYKKEVLRAAGGYFKPAARFSWNPFSPLQEAPRRFDLENGSEIDGPARLEAGGILHRFLIALASDFFRPQYVGAMFSAVYTGERFDPNTSPARISRLVSRLRDWFKENEIPLGIETAELTYRLYGMAPFILMVRSDVRLPESKTDLQRADAIKSLREQWPYQSFSSKEAAEFLNVSARTAQSYLTWAAENKKIRATGAGRAKRYHFAK